MLLLYNNVEEVYLFKANLHRIKCVAIHNLLLLWWWSSTIHQLIVTRRSDDRLTIQTSVFINKFVNVITVVGFWILDSTSRVGIPTARVYLGTYSCLKYIPYNLRVHNYNTPNHKITSGCCNLCSARQRCETLTNTATYNVLQGTISGRRTIDWTMMVYLMWRFIRVNYSKSRFQQDPLEIYRRGL